jgi:histidinol-phosphate aminotransferase
MAKTSLVRKNIQALSPYIAGKPIEETKRELGLETVIKMASNENPLGPSPKAVAAVKKAVYCVNRYPDSNSYYLKKKLAHVFKLDPGNFVLGNGSDELIDIVIKTFVNEDENIVTSEQTFLEYEIIAKVNNRRVKKVPLKDFKFDLAAMKKKISSKTKLVFIANPNNPTGTYVNRVELGKFLKGLPGSVIVVVDEAYDTFIDVNDYPRGTDYIKKHNLIVLRTFSKAYGLSGLRIGCAISDKRLAMFMEKSRQPFNVNLLAQSAALAALDDKAFLKKTRETNLKGKRFLYSAFRKMGLRFVPSTANFILLDVGMDCLSVFRKLLKEGVIVRDMKQYGLDNFVRVTIATPKENARFIKALKCVLGGKR